MAIELKMPALSPTMEKGTLAKWLVVEGDRVRAGDLVAEIETDKATMELEAIDDGRVTKLLIAEGTDDVAVGAAIALLAGKNEEAAEARPAATGAPPTPSPPPARPASAGYAPSAVAVIERPTAIAKANIAPAMPHGRLGDRFKISPLAARIAEAKNLDMAGIVGTGPSGRIIRADLGISSARTTVPDATAAAPTPAAAFAPPPAGVPVETVKLSSMRTTIARRLSEAKQTVPHYLIARCNLDPLLALRGHLNATLTDRGIKLSVNDMLIKALALALQQVPEANVQYGGDVLHRFGRADVSMAVAIEGGLVTPVLRDAGSLSLSAIAIQSKALAARAREGRLLPEDYEGGTVSLSNLGMFGIDEMVPVINPPQALIIGAAAGIEQPWRVDGRIELATIMAATASFDHRAINGAVAAAFMQAFRDLIENPLRLSV